jgi:triphosphoribosyl-dephospho-CoA synthase
VQHDGWPALGSAKIAEARIRDPLALAYIDACLDELRAPKPGNVSVDSPGHDMVADDFVRSAVCSAPWLCRPELALGERILGAIEATRGAVGCNTNLGIVLLCAPLLMAVQQSPRSPLRSAARSLLAESTVADARAVFAAIRVAAPAGLGQAEVHDVGGTPSVPLREVMEAAEHRDRIARQYARGFEDVLVSGRELLNDAAKRFESQTWQTVALYLGLLATIPDTHVERKYGQVTALEVLGEAARLRDMLQQQGACALATRRLGEFDAALKRRGINPGTTADLTVATLLASRLEQMHHKSAAYA